MSAANPLPPGGASAEVTGLIETLHRTGERLEEIMAGEIDTVSDGHGHTFLLLNAQEQLRRAEEARQAAILNALPAFIALIDADGCVVAVNDAWRSFDRHEAAVEGPGHGIGVNYLEACRAARGEGADGAHAAALGMRAVLDGSSGAYTVEYSSQAAAHRHWFQLMVTPVGEERGSGAVVMHRDVTLERRTHESLHSSELLFRQMAENIRDVFFLRDVDGGRTLYVSPAYEEIWGRTRANLYANPRAWLDAIHPDDRVAIHRQYDRGVTNGAFEFDYRIVRPDGTVRWIKSRGFPVQDEAGVIVRIAGVAEDITDRKNAARDLLESERRFGDLLRNVDLASVMLDCDGRITFCNDYLLRLTGWTSEEVVGGDWFDLFTPAPLGDIRSAFRELLSNQPEAWHLENEIFTRSGERRLIRWSNSVLRSGAGEVIGTASIGEDVTEQRLAETRIQRLNRVYEVLSGINALIVRVSDRTELYREACRIAVEAGFTLAWLGLCDRQAGKVVPVASRGLDDGYMQHMPLAMDDANSLPARACREGKVMILNDMRESPYAELKEAGARRGFKSMIVLPLVVAEQAVGVLTLYAGEYGYFNDDETRLLRELAGNIAFAIDHIDRQERLDYLAYHDVLTGLANRALFVDRLSQYTRSAASGGHKLALYLIDLERFKNINDSLGRPAGDAVLKQVAQWLSERAGDAKLVARLGADHFAAMLPDVRRVTDMARPLDRALDDFLDHPFHFDDTVLRIGAKVGVAIYPDDGTDADTLFKNAEAALRRSKRQGERIVFYASEMNARVAESLAMETRLRRAVERRAFVLHYQPKISLASGRITGAEALIRWQDEGKGLVPPIHFIPVLEETGMIVEVGRWVVEQVFADLRSWAARDLNLDRISVNVSAIQLQRKDFVEGMIGEIARGGDSPERLELEITESVVMRNVEESTRKLSILREMGVAISIDDFGTGYSSLSYLGRLPLDSLKIDRSFVNDMGGGGEAISIVSTIIALAHGLNLKVVAEGVETEEQSGTLKRLGCDEAQGYLFGKPLPIGDFEAAFLRPGAPALPRVRA